jgi:hypothetical protein
VSFAGWRDSAVRLLAFAHFADPSPIRGGLHDTESEIVWFKFQRRIGRLNVSATDGR